MIIRAVVALGIGWGALYGMQTLWLKAVTTQISNNSGFQLAMPTPAFPTMAIDTSKMMQAINPPLHIDTKKYQAIAIESMVRQIDQQNRNALSHVPVVPYIPGVCH
jgi:hypothetical protein